MFAVSSSRSSSSGSAFSPVVKVILDRQLPASTQLANARLRAVASFTFSKLGDLTEEDVERLESKTSFSRKIGALVDTGRHEELEVVADRFDPEQGAFRELSQSEARKILENELAGFDYDFELEVREIDTYDFGWTFFWQSAEYLRTGEFSKQLVGQGPVIIDRYTGIVWHSGSAFSEKTCVENYRSTGNPMRARDE